MKTLLLLTFLLAMKTMYSYKNVMPLPKCYSNKLLNCYQVNITQDISCYNLKRFNKAIPYLNENFDKENNSIYFIESSCNGGLNSRQACAIESAALSNPDRKIYVFFVGPLKIKFTNRLVYKTLKSLKVNFYRINLKEFSRNTPLEGIFNKFMRDSWYPVTHCSDFLKLLILYKYGGVYLDLDVIVIKNFDTLLNNFIARQSEDLIASGVMGISKDGIGKEFAELSIQYLAENPAPKLWNGNSNNIYTKTLKQICANSEVKHMNEGNCEGFKVLDSKYFYPVKWEEWITYYEDFEGDIPEYAETYTHHFWNAYGGQIDVHPNSYYARLAKKFCPRIYQLYGNKFGQ